MIFLPFGSVCFLNSDVIKNFKKTVMILFVFDKCSFCFQIRMGLKKLNKSNLKNIQSIIKVVVWKVHFFKIEHVLWVRL